MNTICIIKPYHTPRRPVSGGGAFILRSCGATPYRRASANKLAVVGSAVPFSHLDTACRLTPSVSATNSCVMPRSCRCCRSVWARLWRWGAFCCCCFSRVCRYFHSALMASTTSVTFSPAATRRNTMYKSMIGFRIAMGSLLSLSHHTISVRLRPPTVAQPAVAPYKMPAPAYPGRALF